MYTIEPSSRFSCGSFAIKRIAGIFIKMLICRELGVTLGSCASVIP